MRFYGPWPSVRRSLVPSYIFFVLLTVFCCATEASTVVAQGGVNYTGNGGRHAIQGRIFFPSGRRSDMIGIKVRLENVGMGELIAFADPSGTFVFKNLTAGTYAVVIEGIQDYETAREPIYIDDPGSSNLRGATQSAGTAARVFNVQVHLQFSRKAKEALNHAVIRVDLANVPKPALDSYEKAIAFARKGESRAAAEELRRATVLYPQFSAAFTEMGVQYIKLGQFEEAATAFQSALAIDPDDFTARLGYGVALQSAQNFSESEEQLRKAIKRNETSATAHMYLGITLVRLKRYPDAQKELEHAVSLPGGEGLAQAHKYLGGIYWNSANYKRAADEMEKYLKLDPKAADAERIKNTIKDLRRRQ